MPSGPWDEATAVDARSQGEQAKEKGGQGQKLRAHSIFGLVRKEEPKGALGRRWKNAEKVAKI